MAELGNTLKNAREKKGFSLQEAAAATKIKFEYLRALEAEQLDQLPPPAYVKGFLKIYARFLDLAPEPLLELYSERYRVVEPQVIFADQKRVPPIPFLPAIKLTHLVQVVGLAAVLVLIVFGVFKLLRGHKKMPSSTSGFAEIDNPYTRETIERVKLPSEMAPFSAPAVSSFNLEARAEEDVWLEVYADGALLFYSTLRANAPIRWEARKGYKIRVGNPDKIRFLLNGEEVNFPKTISSDTRFSIDREGIKFSN